MTPLDPHAQLPLTCTRSGDCCHGHRIGVTPWEIALLANQLGTTQREVRDAHTTDGGTRLRFDGASDSQGRHACTFFAGDQGCRVHPGRPLACRVYPLARRREIDRSYYTFATKQNPCLTRCPEVASLPKQRLSDWLANQDVEPGQTAHDAYGDLIWGLLCSAASIAAAADLDTFVIAEEISRRCSLSGDERIPFLPPPWYDLLTIPEIPVSADDPGSFVLLHARRLQQAVAKNFALPSSLHDTALLLMTMAIHFSPSVGLDQSAVIAAFVAQAQAQAASPVTAQR
jgi:uncharacterized protein